MLTVGQIETIWKQSKLTKIQFSESIGKSKGYLNQLTCNNDKDFVVKDKVSAAVYAEYPVWCENYLRPGDITVLERITVQVNREKVKEIPVEKVVQQLTIGFDTFVKNCVKDLKGPLHRKKNLADLNLVIDEDNIADFCRVILDNVK